MSDLWAPNLSTSVNSGSLVVWVDAENTAGYALSGSVTITDDDYGTNPIIETIYNLGTAGSAFSRLTLNDTNSPQLMTGSFTTLNGFKFGYKRTGWSDTKMTSSIFPPVGSAARQVFLVASQIFHGAGSRGSNYKSPFGYGEQDAGKLFAFTFDGSFGSFDNNLSVNYFGSQQLHYSPATFTSADPFGLCLSGYTAVGGTNGSTSLYFNSEEGATENRTLETEPHGGLTLGGITLAGGTDQNNADFILHEMLIYETGVEGADSKAGFKRIVEGYLAHKWGFEGSLPSGHPYKSSAPPAIIFETEESTPSLPDIGSDFVINQYRNMSVQYARNIAQIPFSKGLNGVPNLRKTETPYSSSLG